MKEFLDPLIFPSEISYQNTCNGGSGSYNSCTQGEGWCNGCTSGNNSNNGCPAGSDKPPVI